MKKRNSYFIPAGLLIGLGVGMALGHPGPGLFIGLGLGLLVSTFLAKEE